MVASTEFKIEITIKIMRMLRALDNYMRLQIVQFILNSSPASFSDIHSYLQEISGQTISKGTLTYHLDLLLNGNVLSKRLERGKGREYSKYNITEEVEKIFEKLGLIVIAD